MRSSLSCGKRPAFFDIRTLTAAKLTPGQLLAAWTEAAQKASPAGFGVFGLLSYGVYILHGALYALLQAIHVDPGPNALAAILVAVIAATGAAIADRVYDRPMRAPEMHVLHEAIRLEEL